VAVNILEVDEKIPDPVVGVVLHEAVVVAVTARTRGVDVAVVEMTVATGDQVVGAAGEEVAVEVIALGHGSNLPVAVVNGVVAGKEAALVADTVAATLEVVTNKITAVARCVVVTNSTVAVQPRIKVVIIERVAEVIPRQPVETWVAAADITDDFKLEKKHTF